MNRPCLPETFLFYHTTKSNAKENNTMKEKVKYPIPRHRLYASINWMILGM